MQNQGNVFLRAFKTLVVAGMFIVFSLSLLSFDESSMQESLDGERSSGVVSSREVDLGERLFKGLIPAGPDAASCVSCHNVHDIDTFNWNPSAYEIALLYEQRDADDLKNVVLEPSTEKMTEVHQGYELTDQQFLYIKAWMDEVAEEGIKSRPVITNLLLFILLLFVFIAALSDLVIFRKVPYRIVHLVVILGAGLFMLKTIAHEAVALGRSQYYEPDQPIKFSHKVHAHDNQTDCLYCHSVAEYSHQAGIPAVSQCMNCHIIVREGTYSGRFEINKLVNAYENEMPVEWIKVHDLPDHVFFSHSQHIGSAGLDCAECHGDVEQMDRLMQAEDLSMGWCLDCHRSTGVDILNNEFYSLYEKLREDVREGRIDIATARETGGTDCMKCHY